jgi:hypothetical protein
MTCEDADDDESSKTEPAAAEAERASATMQLTMASTRPIKASACSCKRREA